MDMSVRVRPPAPSNLPAISAARPFPRSCKLRSAVFRFWKRDSETILCVSLKNQSFMKNFYFSLLLLFAFAWTPAAFAQKRTKTSAQQEAPPPPPPAVEYNARAWKTFVSPEGGFSVSMPGTPVKAGELLTSDSGPLAHYSHTLKTSMAEYGVSYSDFPYAINEPEQIKSSFDSGRDALLADMKLRLTSERDITIDGFPGRQIVAESETYAFHDRFLAVNKRLYQVVIVVPKGKQKPTELARFYDSTVDKFFGSFKLINTAEVTNGKTSQKSSEVTALEMGRIENSVYINEYFGLRMNVPPNWNVVAREVNEVSLDVGKEILRSGDKSLDTAVDKSIGKTVVLLAAGKYPMNSPGPDPALLQCGAEKLAGPQMTSAAYLEGNKRILLASPLKLRLTRDTYTETIGGLTFAAFDLENQYAMMLVKQKYYATITKGYALFFVISYVADEDHLTLSDVLKTVKFGSEKPAN